MDDKELHKQKFQAQLDEWKADLAAMKAKASGVKADTQLKMNKHIKELDKKLHEAGAKLSDLTSASDEAWESVKKGVESAWASLKSSLGDAKSKFKD